VQQLLSLIAQYGGATAADAYRVLCRNGAFSRVIESDGIATVVNDISNAALIPHLRALAAHGPADGVQLAMSVANKPTEKHHIFLNEQLLSIDYASARLDTEGAWQAVVQVVNQIEERCR
jgi:hypothetical protein